MYYVRHLGRDKQRRADRMSRVGAVGSDFLLPNGRRIKYQGGRAVELSKDYVHEHLDLFLRGMDQASIEVLNSDTGVVLTREELVSAQGPSVLVVEIPVEKAPEAAPAVDLPVEPPTPVVPSTAQIQESVQEATEAPVDPMVVEQEPAKLVDLAQETMVDEVKPQVELLDETPVPQEPEVKEPTETSKPKARGRRTKS